ncbi:YhgE/Pip domain-containing protein [Bacillus sp. CGMCC 1.16541]|uniref:YhgE/Pip domain-containing protein n=1 Tax=Bacillus sp. CGMCC 1.16541 TaxID=2185143 RepID=UPI000D735ED8|nr:YhgE/Pip domain-containing protein [Bacillus sp. CGMCC 1.16541]
MKQSTLRSEFAALFKNKKLLIPVLAVLFIPLLYAGMFLWAFWDPYDQLDELPVAIVNKDAGATLNEEPLNVGDELVTKLKDNPQFKWKFVDEKEAKKGLEDQTYYMVIEIPKNFSQHATTLQDDKPMNMDLVYTPNESFNFLSAQIGGTAVDRIKEEVSNELTKTYAEEVFSKIQDVSDGLAAASDGATELHDGINKAKDGSSELNNGLVSAKDGTSKLDDGIGKAKDGAGKLSNGLDELNGGIVSAKDGSSRLNQGVNQAKDGAGKLSNGLNELNSGVGQMKDGQSQLLEGAQKAQGGSEQLSSGLQKSLAGMKEMDGKLPQLTEGTKGVSDGASKLATSLDAWQQGAQKTKAGAQQVNQGLADMEAQIDQLIKTTDDPQQLAMLKQFKESVAQLSAGNQQVEGGLGELAGSASQLQAGASDLSTGASQVHQGQVALSGGVKELLKGQEQLANGAAELTKGQGALVQGLETFGEKISEAKSGVSQLAKGGNDLSTGLGELSDGSNELSSGMSRLAQGSNELAKGGNDLSSGLGELSNGSTQLFSGVSRLLEGSSELTDGMGQLSEGSNELSSKLQEGADETSKVKANDDVYEMFAKPVEVKEKRVNEVPNYGTGFAPYFLSLGLFVGALLLSIVFPLREPASVPKNGFSWFIGKFGVLVLVGVLQAILADVVLLAFLGIEVQSVPLFVTFSIITSLTYIALIQFLVTTMGDPGRFVAIIILILQLTTSAGTFPLELIPGFLQHFNPLLPMTYSVAGFKAVISSGDYTFMWQNAWILGLFFAATVVGTIIYFTVQHKRQFKNTSETEVSF